MACFHNFQGPLNVLLPPDMCAHTLSWYYNVLLITASLR